MFSQIPTITLNNGVVIPALGFGVFPTPPDETIAAVETALKTGYRHIDTAAGYFNEREAGDGIRRSGIDRSEVFIETKVWITDYGYDKTLHRPAHLAPAAAHPVRLTIGAYKALETLLADGKVRAIGISNFMPDDLGSAS